MISGTKTLNNTIEDFVNHSQILQAQAENIIRITRIREIWGGIGAKVNLVGSARMGLMARNRDIDFHIYTDPFSFSDSFRAMAQLAEDKHVRSITYANLLEAEDGCVEWHAVYRDDAGGDWKIDMIHILTDSPYAGYFEQVAERVRAVLTPEIREAILKIKFGLPEEARIPGIRVYRAVIEGGARDLQDYRIWDEAHPMEGIDRWMP
jgi:hypothetical protein